MTECLYGGKAVVACWIGSACGCKVVDLIDHKHFFRVIPRSRSQRKKRGSRSIRFRCVACGEDRTYPSSHIRRVLSKGVKLDPRKRRK